MSIGSLSVQVRHRGIAIDGSALAQLLYDSLNLPKVATVDPFLSADDERARQASLKFKEEKGRLSAEGLASRYIQDVIGVLDEIRGTETGRVVSPRSAAHLPATAS